jgi:hypothetical protein
MKIVSDSTQAKTRQGWQNKLTQQFHFWLSIYFAKRSDPLIGVIKLKLGKAQPHHVGAGVALRREAPGRVAEGIYYNFLSLESCQ